MLHADNPDGTRTLLGDALGSTLASADATGALPTQYTYEPFGATAASGRTDANAFQYTGQENDGTGLYYYRARYYHPGLARFLSEDPIGFTARDINLYGYVANDPISLIDPLGLEKQRRWAEGVKSSETVSIGNL